MQTFSRQRRFVFIAKMCMYTQQGGHLGDDEVGAMYDVKLYYVTMALFWHACTLSAFYSLYVRKTAWYPHGVIVRSENDVEIMILFLEYFRATQNCEVMIFLIF